VLILPAIDLRDGHCVRLRQGDFSRETRYDSDPVRVARRFVDAGAEAIHVVDLDAARDGRPAQRDVIRAIVAAVGVPVQVGGGVRTDADIAELIDAGVARVVVGTQALKDREWLIAACRERPGRLALGLDARDGRVATHGWTETSHADVVATARSFDGLPLAGLIYTDIARDGMLSGPNLPAYERLVEAVALPVFASGGVAGENDIRELAAAGVAGCVVGRALYEGRLDLARVITLARSLRTSVARSGGDRQPSATNHSPQSGNREELT
jgi:phosphoribosylformimino-5-aminoimidazole carboxamide ribotide isomerase